ncbi:diacylglycerol O-acyltransferase 1 [Collariella sp. IMI 366227]|nr:diacylglycerol O-acyltransferase 1 [Collariella sp. IMI 366227]
MREKAAGQKVVQKEEEKEVSPVDAAPVLDFPQDDTLITSILDALQAAAVAQSVDTDTASQDGGSVSAIPHDTSTPARDNATEPNLAPSPDSRQSSAPSKRASICQSTDFAESTGDIAEKEAEISVTDASSVDNTVPPEAESIDSEVPGDGDTVYGSTTQTTSRRSSTTLRNRSNHRQRQPALYPPLTNRVGREAKRRERARADAYRAGPIRFAPWNIPYRRRLQTLAVIAHCLSIATSVSVFFFLCANPLLWGFLIFYLVRMLSSKAATDGRLRRRSEWCRRLPLWNLFAEYFPAELHKTHDLPPTRKYIFGYHPHGIISHGAFAAFATEALGFSDKFPGITNSLLTLDSNFRIPLYTDYILSMGLQSVSKESITNILSTGGPNGEGMGRAVTIVVGGARESLEAEPGRMRLVLAERKGFVKVAIQNGADLVPVLCFGENELYDQVDTKARPYLHSIQMWVLRTLKFTLPFLHGRGDFQL